MVLLLPLLDPPTPSSICTTANTPSVPNTPTEWHNTQQDLSASIWHRFQDHEKLDGDNLPDEEDHVGEEWDWDVEHEDRKKETDHDKSRDHLGEGVFQVRHKLPGFPPMLSADLFVFRLTVPFSNPCSLRSSTHPSLEYPSSRVEHSTKRTPSG